MISEEDKLPNRIELIAGVDVAYTNNLAIGAIAVLEYNSLRNIETQIAICTTKMPYVPTLLAFREIPPVTVCMKKLEKKPDIFLVDGHGISHPFNFGFASHFGLSVGKPTIGVAKNKLVGEAVREGEAEILNYNGKIVGAVVKTSVPGKPIYVSVGHYVSLPTAVEIVRKSTIGGRIPEPLKRAHSAASQCKTQLEKIGHPQKI